MLVIGVKLRLNRMNSCCHAHWILHVVNNANLKIDQVSCFYISRLRGTLL